MLIAEKAVPGALACLQAAATAGACLDALLAAPQDLGVVPAAAVPTWVSTLLQGELGMPAPSMYTCLSPLHCCVCISGALVFAPVQAMSGSHVFVSRMIALPVSLKRTGRLGAMSINSVVLLMRKTPFNAWTTHSLMRLSSTNLFTTWEFQSPDHVGDIRTDQGGFPVLLTQVDHTAEGCKHAYCNPQVLQCMSAHWQCKCRPGGGIPKGGLPSHRQHPGPCFPQPLAAVSLRQPGEKPGQEPWGLQCTQADCCTSTAAAFHSQVSMPWLPFMHNATLASSSMRHLQCQTMQWTHSALGVFSGPGGDHTCAVWLKSSDVQQTM